MQSCNLTDNYKCMFNYWTLPKNNLVRIFFVVVLFILFLRINLVKIPYYKLFSLFIILVLCSIELIEFVIDCCSLAFKSISSK